MKSLTKADVTNEQIEKATAKFFGAPPKRYRELNDGYYNISYLVTLEDSKEVVLKIAPSHDVDILTYEKDIIKTELLFYKLTEKHTDIKAPKILGEDFSGEIMEYPYYFMSKIEGITLDKVKKVSKEERQQVCITLAEYMAKLHNIKGEEYGYITMIDECRGKDCLNSLIVSVRALLDDAHRKNMKLPYKEADIYALFESTAKAFADIEYPVVCHYDLWDGNVLGERGETGLNVTGVIDFERGFYACPAADFCQIIRFVDFEKDTYFLEEYNKHAYKKLEYSHALLTRILAYQFYLFLIMHVECDYRDISGSFVPQKLWVATHIGALYKRLKKAIAKV